MGINKINEQLMRSESKKRWQKLYNNVKKQGGDIGEKVAKSEQTKQTSIPNAYYINNPWDGKRHIDTYESFCLKESKKQEKSLEDMYTTLDGNGIDDTDFNWIKGDKEDKKRPMFNNHSDIIDNNALRIGTFIEIDGVIGQIKSIKDKKVTIDIINNENEHELKVYELSKILKK